MVKNSQKGYSFMKNFAEYPVACHGVNACLAAVVGIIKSKSARGLFREFPRTKRRLWAEELWEDRYFARMVGDHMTRQIIEKYIKHYRDIEQGPAQLF
jgi:hypothetical protein